MTDTLHPPRPRTEARPTPTGMTQAVLSVAAAERRFCRMMLPRVSRTFALNIRLLGGSMREAVRIGYLLCRIADTIEDAWPGDRREVERRFDQLVSALSGDPHEAEVLATGAPMLNGRASDAHVELVAGSPRVLRAFAALAPADRGDLTDAVTTMAAGMRRYAGRAAERRGERLGATSAARDPGDGTATFPYLDDDAELADYCWIVAGCVGVMLTHLFSRRSPAAPEQPLIALAPAVGEGLQLTNILLDWPLDLRSGRCHVPASWLRELGLAPRDLVGRERREVRILAQRLEQRARGALARVPDYLATIPSRYVRYRMFCLWPALWAAASLEHARRDPTFPWGARRPRLPKRELWGIAAASLARGHTARGVESQFRELGVKR